MATTVHRATIVPSPSTPRVRLVPFRAGRALLDGGWWPRSTDPYAELPGLILALRSRFGLVRQLILNDQGWDSHPRQLAISGEVIRLGWFVSVDPALVIATTVDGDQLDVLVVPVGAAEVVARVAMARAAAPANRTRASAAMAAAAVLAAGVDHDDHDDHDDRDDPDEDAGLAWENEGGSQIGAGQAPTTGPVVEPVTGRGTRS